MSNLNSTPSASRVHIGFFGKRNAGKSSLVNAVTSQELSVVSDVLGTTTDPVQKSMELLPLGPVVIIDTPGFDDNGELGEKRIEKTKQILAKTDIAVLVVDSKIGLDSFDNELINLFKEKQIPYIIAFNKSDENIMAVTAENEISVSAKSEQGIDELKEKIAMLKPTLVQKYICADLLKQGDVVLLVCPIDESAPKGRMILPQVQTLREVLDASATAMVVKETELENALKVLSKPPALVITDSQVFGFVKTVVPKDVPLTSFSILMARYKGFLDTAVQGAAAIKKLKDGDKVLISEGCTHHRQCNDIGTVKLPNLIKKFTGKDIQFSWSSGTQFPNDLSEFSLVIHCGACMLNEREVSSRSDTATSQNTPFTNYGISIAYMNGILERSVEMFPDIKKLLD